MRVGTWSKRRVLESIAPAYAEDSLIPSLGNRLRTALGKRGIMSGIIRSGSSTAASGRSHRLW